MTTERYLEEWRTADLITAEQHALLLTLVRKQRFSVFLELNALLYLGVLAIAAGVAWTVQEHFASLGDVLVLITLTSVFAACLWYCFTRGVPYAPGRVAAATFSFDYVLYLGCLVFAAEIAYLEYRFHLLGVDWQFYLLGSAALYCALAYRFDNRFVLSLALSTLAGWFGVRLSVSTFFGGSTSAIALVYGAVVAGAGMAFDQLQIKRHFFETYLHVATNAVLFALASGTSQSSNVVWLIPLAVACAAAVERGVRFKRFAFVVYGVIYGYVGLSAEVMRVIRGDTSILAYFVISGAAVVVCLVFVSRLFGREE